MPSQNIEEKRYRRLEKKAVEASIEQQQLIGIGDVLKYLIDKKLGEIDPKEVTKYKKGE